MKQYSGPSPVYNSANVATPPTVDAVVYAINSRNGTYKHTAHRIRRVADHGMAVTYCTIWLRAGAVLSDDSDCMVWCEYGCKPSNPS